MAMYAGIVELSVGGREMRLVRVGEVRPGEDPVRGRMPRAGDAIRLEIKRRAKPVDAAEWETAATLGSDGRAEFRDLCEALNGQVSVPIDWRRYLNQFQCIDRSAEKFALRGAVIFD